MSGESTASTIRGMLYVVSLQQKYAKTHEEREFCLGAKGAWHQALRTLEAEMFSLEQEIE
jgi:hypothetical protein